MLLEKVLLKLKEYGVTHKIDPSPIKPNPYVITFFRGDLFTTMLHYSSKPEITEQELHRIKISLNLPNNWWGKTP